MTNSSDKVHHQSKPIILELGPGSVSGVFVMSYERAAKLEPHPLALLFPPLNEDDMDSLTSDILRKGQVHAIVLYENKILDGVHRHKACMTHLLDVKCVRFEDLKYRGSISDFVHSENIERRHVDLKVQCAVSALIYDYEKLAKQQAEAGKVGGKLGGRPTPIGKTLQPKPTEGFPPPSSENQANKTLQAKSPEGFSTKKTSPSNSPENRRTSRKGERYDILCR